MAKEKKSAAQEAMEKSRLVEGTAEVRKQMADPNLMKSKAYVAPKNTIARQKSGDLPPGMGQA